MAFQLTTLTLVALVACASAHASTLRGADALEARMQPEVVAKTLKGVEDKWKEEAATFIECSAVEGQDCSESPKAFSKSCATVVGAVVQGSSGDKRVAKDYMGNVCGQSLLSGWHQQHCIGLKAALDFAMTADSYQNRESFTSTRMCNKFWGEFVAEEKKRFVKEEAERKAAEKKAAEEAAAKAKADAEKAAKDKEEAEKAAVIAKELAEKKAAEEAAQKKIEEAQRVKAEAQKKAAEAAEKLAQKKAEAEEFAKKAQAKMEEAAEAEREHEKAKANMAVHDETVAKKEETVVAKKEEATPVPVVAAVVAAKKEETVVAKKEETVVAKKEDPVVAKKEEAVVAEKAPVKEDKPVDAAPVKAAAAVVAAKALLQQDPCAGCTEGLTQAYQSCAMKHGNPCAETNSAGLVSSGPGTKKDIGCCMKKSKHDRCLKCSGMDVSHGTGKVNKKYNNQRTLK